jgi:hypothetical protein
VPWQYATPETIQTTFDALRVESFEVLEINSPAPRLIVVYDRGQFDPVTEVFSILEEAQTIEIQSSTVLALMLAAPNGATLYDAIKWATYEALNLDGVSPTGSLV